MKTRLERVRRAFPNSKGHGQFPGSNSSIRPEAEPTGGVPIVIFTSLHVCAADVYNRMMGVSLALMYLGALGAPM